MKLKIRTKFITAILLAAVLSSDASFTDTVVPGSGACRAERDYAAEREERMTWPVESNSIADWPTGPAIGAKSAILMEMNTHTILYAKNIHEKNYPASTTKIATCLLAMQNCTMEETLTFSHDAIYDVPSDGSRLGGVDTGDTMLMEHALYCVLVQSANDVASAVGEHVAQKLGKGKSVEAFAELMNEKAESLGCRNTHFSNCNGLYDDNHYTTVYDLALIGCEFFNNELLCKMSSTPSYHFRLHPQDEEDVWISTKNQLYKGKPYEYQYLLGSKTGYVSQSRQTLVSAAEKNGMKLVCVIFTEETPYQFEDTVALFQYGFESFQRMSISDNETKYKIHTMDLFDTENDLFGDSTPLMSMENDRYVILPNTAAFSDVESTLAYNDGSKPSNVFATVNYSYSGVDIGSCNIVFTGSLVPAFSFSASEPTQQPEHPDGEMVADWNDPAEETSEPNVIFINVKKLMIGILIVTGIIILMIVLISVINNYSFSAKGQSSRRRRKRRQESRSAKREARRHARKYNRMMRKKNRKLR